MADKMEYFVGQNGLEYMNKYDADTFGGGCIGKRVVQKTNEILPLDDVEQEEAPVKPEAPTDNPDVNLEVLSFSDLREVARDRKIPGWALLKKKETLIKKIMENSKK